MHIFLTGEIQVGKSTVIAKTLAGLSIVKGGFKTYFVPDRGSADRLLYMNSAREPDVFKVENSGACFRKFYLPLFYTEKFDSWGVELIRSAKANANLILMDECGDFESNAFKFQNEIIKTLDGNQLVFGVIKLASRGWTDIIKNHTKVKLITVTRENRDAARKGI